MSTLDELTTILMGWPKAGTMVIRDGVPQVPIMMGPRRALWFADHREARALADAARIVANVLEAQQVGQAHPGAPPVPGPPPPPVFPRPFPQHSPPPPSPPAGGGETAPGTARDGTADRDADRGGDGDTEPPTGPISVHGHTPFPQAPPPGTPVRAQPQVAAPPETETADAVA